MVADSEPGSRPRNMPGGQERFGDRPVFRISRQRGKRQMVFLPAVVLKLGLSAFERRKLSVEAAGSSAAARDPFWGRLAVRALGLGGAGSVARRFRPVGLGDFDAVSELVEDRMQAALAYPRRPMHEDLPRRRVSQMLTAAERARLAAVVDGNQLPRSSMHGDLHLFNFVRTSDGFRIVDWEHFDPDGSFVFDFVDYHVAVDMLNLQRPWPEVLSRVGTRHRAIDRAARLTGVSPRALLAHYLALKIDTIMARRGAPERFPRDEAQGLLGHLRRALASVGVATCGAPGSGLAQSVMACCAI